MRFLNYIATRLAVVAELIVFFWLAAREFPPRPLVPIPGFFRIAKIGKNIGVTVVGLTVTPCITVVTYLTLVTTDTVSGVNHLVSRCPT
jgi:hypothetical protein